SRKCGFRKTPRQARRGDTEFFPSSGESFPRFFLGIDLRNSRLTRSLQVRNIRLERTTADGDEMNMVRNEGGSAPAQLARAVHRGASRADSVPRVHCWHREAANGGDREAEGGSSSAERTLMILELFSAVRRPLAVGEVSSLVGIPQSSTSVLLRRLQERGYLHYVRARRAYLPTPRVLLLGSWMLDDGVMAVAARAARRIFDEVGCPALVGMRDGLHMRNVHAEGWEREGGFELGRALPLT